MSAKRLRPQFRQWEPLFNEAVAKRDSHKRGTPEYERVQERVLECYQAMYSAGYFRDPYNSWEVLAKFGLSWWDDVIPLLTDEGLLLPSGRRDFWRGSAREPPSLRTISPSATRRPTPIL